MSKDAFNNEIKAGEVVIYAVRRGSSQDIKVGLVKHVRADGALLVRSSEFSTPNAFASLGDGVKAIISTKLSVITKTEQVIRLPITAVPADLFAALSSF